MQWAVYNAAYFSFLRIGEMVVPDDAGFDAAVHLCRQDIGVDNKKYSSMVQVRIKQSKIDLSGKGWTCIWARRLQICAKSQFSLLRYLVVQCDKWGLLFDSRMIQGNKKPVQIGVAIITTLT